MSFAARTDHLQKGWNKLQQLFTHPALCYDPGGVHGREEPGLMEGTLQLLLVVFLKKKPEISLWSSK